MKKKIVLFVISLLAVLTTSVLYYSLRGVLFPVERPTVKVLVTETIRGRAIQVPLGKGRYTIKVVDPETGGISDKCIVEFVRDSPTP